MRNRCLPSTVYRLQQLRKSSPSGARGSRKSFWHTGQSLIEVIVAVTVGILVVTALTFATIFSLRNANFAKNSEQATKLAQEGIERVRSERDRGNSISGFSIGNDLIDSWRQDSKLWSDQINGNCGDTTLIPPTYCYFRFNGLNFQYLGTGSNIPSNAEDLGNGKFKRVVILSDDSSSYTTQKTATVIVRWTDAAGSHDSQLTTILRKI